MIAVAPTQPSLQLSCSRMARCPDDAPRFPCHHVPVTLAETATGIAVIISVEPGRAVHGAPPGTAVTVRNAHGTMVLGVPPHESAPWEALAAGQPVEIAAVARLRTDGPGFTWAPLAVAPIRPTAHPVCAEAVAPRQGTSLEALTRRFDLLRWGCLTQTARLLLDRLLAVVQQWPDGTDESLEARLLRWPAPLGRGMEWPRGRAWRAVETADVARALGERAVAAGMVLDGDVLMLAAILLDVGTLEYGAASGSGSPDGIRHATLSRVRVAGTRVVQTGRERAILDHLLHVLAADTDSLAWRLDPACVTLEARLVHAAAGIVDALARTGRSCTTPHSVCGDDDDNEPSPAIAFEAWARWHARQLARQVRTTAPDAADAPSPLCAPVAPPDPHRTLQPASLTPPDSLLDDCPF